MFLVLLKEMRNLGEYTTLSLSLLFQNKGMGREFKIPLYNSVGGVVSSNPDLLRVGCCSLVSIESLRMIKLIVVVFCHIGDRFYSGKRV